MDRSQVKNAQNAVELAAIALSEQESAGERFSKRDAKAFLVDVALDVAADAGVKTNVYEVRKLAAYYL